MSQAGVEQTEGQFRLPESAVEAVAQFIEILLEVPGRNAMKGSVDELLHIAGHDMHQGQPDIGLFRGSNLLPVFVEFGNNMQCGKRIGFHCLAISQMPGEKAANSGCAHTVHSMYGGKASSFFPGFDRNNHRPFSCGTTASLAETFAADNRVRPTRSGWRAGRCYLNSHDLSNLACSWMIRFRAALTGKPLRLAPWAAAGRSTRRCPAGQMLLTRSALSSSKAPSASTTAHNHPAILHCSYGQL